MVSIKERIRRVAQAVKQRVSEINIAGLERAEARKVQEVAPQIEITRETKPQVELEPVRAVDFPIGSGRPGVIIRGGAISGGPETSAAGLAPAPLSAMVEPVIPSPIPRQTAAEQLPTVKDITDGLPPGAAGIFPVGTGFDPRTGVVTRPGQLPLTPEQEIELRKLAGQPGGPRISPTEFAFTPSGKGTIITETAPDQQRIAFDLKNAIDNQAKWKAEAIYKKEIDLAVNSSKGKFTTDIQSFSNELQDQVNAGQFSVSDANKKLKKYVDKQNKAYQSDVKSQVTSALKDNPDLQRIEDNTLTQYQRLNLGDLEADLIAKKKKQFRDNARFAVEVGVEVAATVVAGPIGAVTAATVIAAGRTISGGIALQSGTVPVYDIKFDDAGKAIDVKIAKEIVTPEAKAEATEQFLMAGIVAGSVLVPGLRLSKSGKVLFTKSLAQQAIETSATKSAQELLEQQLKAGTRKLTQGEIDKGLVRVSLKDTFGKASGQFADIPIKNIKAIKVSEAVAKRRATDIALGKGNRIRYITAGTRDEKLVIESLVKKNELGSYKIGDKTVRELAEQGNVIRFRAYDVAKGKEVDFYGVRALSSVDGKGKQIDIIFKLRGGKISQTSAKVIVTDIETGIADVYRTAKLKEVSKETIKVAIPGVTEAGGPIEIFGVDRLKALDTRLIIQKAKVQEKVGVGVITRKIEKEAVIIKIGKPVRGEPTKSFLEAAAQKTRVTKKIDFEALTKVSAKEFQRLKEKGLKIEIDTVSKSIRATAERGGLVAETGVVTKLPKPIIFDIAQKKVRMDFSFLADDVINIDKFLKEQAKKQVGKKIKLPPGVSQKQVFDVPKMVGGEGLLESIYTRAGLAPQETFAPAISIDILGFTKGKAPLIPQLGKVVMAPQISLDVLLRPASQLIFGKDIITEKQLLRKELKIAPLSELDFIKPIQAKVAKPAQVILPKQIQAPISKEVSKTLLKQLGIEAPVVVAPKLRAPKRPPMVPDIFIPLIPIVPFGKKLTAKEQRDRRVKIPRRLKRTKFTASLAAAIFGITAKVKRKDIKKLSKKLDVFPFTGAETRPLIEIVNNKGKKKTKVKKIKPIDFNLFDL